MRRVYGIGDTVLDIIFKEGEPVAAVPGGSVFNTMVSLGRTVGDRYPIIMVSGSGDDKVGRMITDFMSNNGLNTDAFKRKQGISSNISLAFLDNNNDAEYQFFKTNEILSETDVPQLMFQRGDILIAGSHFAIAPEQRAYTKAIISKAHQADSIFYYDVNFRKNKEKESKELLPAILENISLCDIVRGSIEDFRYLFGETDPVSIYNTHIKSRCNTFICTCGSGPVHIFSSGKHLVFPVTPIETVSTIGAGDNFNAGVLLSLLEYNILKDNLSEVTDSLWEKIVKISEQFSANVCKSLFNYVDRGFSASVITKDV